MEKPRADSEPGLVPFHDNGNGFHGAENLEIPAAEKLTSNEVALLVISQYEQTGEDQASIVASIKIQKLIEKLSKPNEMSIRQREHYQVVTHLMDQPQFKYSHPTNASGSLAKELDFNPKQWENIYRKIKNVFHIIGFETDEKTRFSKAVYLNIDGLLKRSLEVGDSSFISDELLITLQERLEDKDIDIEEKRKRQYINEINEIINIRTYKKLKPLRYLEEKRKRQVERAEAWELEKEKRERARKTAQQLRRLTKEIKRAKKRREQEARTRAERAPDDLNFNFLIAEGGHFTATYGRKKFSELDPTIKLLLAIGHSKAFVKDAESQEEYMMRLLNKEVKEEDKFDEESFFAFLREAEDDQLVAKNGIYTITKPAFEKLKAEKIPPHVRRQTEEVYAES